MDIIGWGRSPRHWMQGRNPKEGNCFFEQKFLHVGCQGFGHFDPAFS